MLFLHNRCSRFLGRNKTFQLVLGHQTFFWLSVLQNGFRFIGKLSYFTKIVLRLMDTLVLLILLLLLDSSLEHRFVFALLISRCWKRDNKWISRNDLREGINCPSNNHINVLPWHHKRYFFSTLWDVIVWIVEVLIRRFWNVLLSI